MQYTTNYSLKKPQYNEPADVADINYNADSIDNLLYKNRRISTGAEWDNSTQYAVGDLVVYEHVLYRCVTATSGAWDSSAWVVTHLTDEVLDAKASGGTEVEANPTGTATGTLEKIGIDGDIYEIEGGGGGSSTLAGLTDVDLATPTAGQMLVYDSASAKWQNQTVSGGTHTYSTSEQAVGTWIDGSTIYERTFTGLSVALNGNNWFNLVQIADIDLILNVDAYSNDASPKKCAIPEIGVTSDGTVQVSGLQGYNRTIATAVVRYTKTASASLQSISNLETASISPISLGREEISLEDASTAEADTATDEPEADED